MNEQDTIKIVSRTHKVNKIVKAGLKRSIDLSVALMRKTIIGRYLYARIIENAMSRAQQVEYRGVNLLFSIPNALTRYRADTFPTKEPETLEWLDTIPREAVLWDIGANVGLYTCYAAKARGCRVLAFEPSVFNLECLARNVFLNQLTGLVTILPLALSDATALTTLNLSTTEWGGALSSFGQTYGHDGKPLQIVFAYPTLGLSMVDAVQLLSLPPPSYIKMDVDGIEHLVLKGGLPLLKGVTNILIEINDSFTQQAQDAQRYLEGAGFVLKEKRHAAIFDKGMAQYTFNQIWVK